MKSPARQNRGSAAEALAAHYLEQRGLRVVERNYRCRHGEIDLIARDGATLVFVEVRLRTHPGFGDAAASITRGKRAKLAAAAAYYLSVHDSDSVCRFDAVLLDRLDSGCVEWLRDVIIA